MAPEKEARRSVDDLGLAPRVEQVDEWLTTSAQYTRSTIGTSLQGRDLHVYSSLENPDLYDEPVVLFLSLVHGNEPGGLLSLLWTVEHLMATSNDSQDSKALRGKIRNIQGSPTIILFPIVNIDSYVANLEYGNGCRRTNMRNTCANETQFIYACPQSSHGGVDLNRNHPMDWDGTFAGDDDLGGSCGITYKGEHAWSEPEARAIRDVVLRFRPMAAMSFHTRGLIESEALLIHPFTSARPVELLENLRLFRDWSRKLNDRNLYITGTAQEAIQYTASGSTIDWMASQGVLSFVMESRTPCREGRWCPNEYRDAVKKITQQDGRTGMILVDLVAELKLKQNRLFGHLSYSTLVVLAIILFPALFIVRRSRIANRAWLGQGRRSLRRTSKAR